MGGENLLHDQDFGRKKEVIPSDKVNKMVDSLGSDLDIPKDRLEIAKKSQVFLVDKDTFYEALTEHAKQLGFRIPEEYLVDENGRKGAEAVANLFGTSIEEIASKKKKQMEDFYKEYSATRGISICSENGEKMILINKDEVGEKDKDEVLTHELLHSMMDTPKHGSGFNSEIGYGHFLNEATVQLMTLRAKYKDMGWSEFSEKVINRSIKSVGYEKQVDTLLVLMRATSFGNEEYTFERLKGDYFNTDDDAGTKAVLVKMYLIKGAPDKIGTVSGMKEKMQDLFESRLEGTKTQRRWVI